MHGHDHDERPEVLIVANPYSGARHNAEHVRALQAALQAQGLAPHVVWDIEERRALLADPALPERCRCLVAAGGDGTLANVVNELCRGQGEAANRLAVAMLPLGNENLFAKQFGYSLDAPAMARAVARGQSTPMDLGDANGRLYTLMAGVGFDAEVIRRLARWRAAGTTLKRAKRLSYVGRVLGATLAYRYPPLHIHADGVEADGSHLFVFNLPLYGLNLRIAQHADGHDGQLDWILFRKRGRLAVVSYLGAVACGRHLHRADVLVGRAKTITVHSDGTAPMQLDGEAAGETPVQITVRPDALRVVRMEGRS